MKQKKDWVILSHLRKDARKSLVKLSNETGIPASTIYDRVNTHEKGIIKRYTALLDFNKMGFYGRVYVAIKLNDSKKRDELFNFLREHKSVNSLYRINFGYHLLFEAIFKDVAEADSFIADVQHRFGINEHQIFNVIEEIKKEDFLTENASP